MPAVPANKSVSDFLSASHLQTEKGGVKDTACVSQHQAVAKTLGVAGLPPVVLAPPTTPSRSQRFLNQVMDRTLPGFEKFMPRD